MFLIFNSYMKSTYYPPFTHMYFVGRQQQLKPFFLIFLPASNINTQYTVTNTNTHKMINTSVPKHPKDLPLSRISHKVDM